MTQEFDVFLDQSGLKSNGLINKNGDKVDLCKRKVLNSVKVLQWTPVVELGQRWQSMRRLCRRPLQFPPVCRCAQPRRSVACTT